MLVVLTSFITFVITIYYLNNYYVDKYSTDNVLNSSNLDDEIKNVKKSIDKYFLWNDKIDENKLKSSAIKGYVSGLEDEYTEYIPKEEMKDYTESLSGNFTGIGIYMTSDEKSGRVVVYYPIEGSPAQKAGIKAGDLIISVDGIEYTYDDFKNIAKFIKGEQGTSVNIVIERNGDRMSFDITREKITLNPISTRIIDGKIGYLKLPSFDEETAKEFEEKVKELKENGAESLIIDLRNNGGGIVQEATNIADMFLDKGKTIISTKDNKGNNEITYSTKEPIFNMPLVVLVNENSASASEILVCSLKENNRAKVIGTKTFGKGIIQTVLTLSDGSGLKITTNEYYTPNGSNIHKIGITPDEEVLLPESNNNIYDVEEKDDTQLKRAIEILK